MKNNSKQTDIQSFSRPIPAGSILHEALQMIATDVARRLTDNASANPDSANGTTSGTKSEVQTANSQTDLDTVFRSDDEESTGAALAR